jgi:hypothetical protein
MADGRSRDRRTLEEAVFELLESSSPENLVSIERWSFGEGPVDIALRVLCEFGAVDDGLRLTPLGRWAQGQMQAHLAAPISAELDAADLLKRLAASPVEEAWVRAQPWLASRSPVEYDSLLAGIERVEGRVLLGSVPIVAPAGVWEPARPAEASVVLSGMPCPATGVRSRISSPAIRADGDLANDRGVPRAPVTAGQERAARLVQVVFHVLHVGVADLDRLGEEGDRQRV